MSFEQMRNGGLPAKTLKLAVPTLAALAAGGGLAAAAADPAGQVKKAAEQASEQPAAVYLKLDGVTGDSRGPGHPGEIDVQAYSFGVSNSGGSSSSGGAGAGKAKFSSFNVAKLHDSASPKLLTATAQGKHFKEATITYEKPDDKSPGPFLTYKLSDVIISSYQHGGTGAGTESVSFDYAKIETSKTDGANPPITGGWDQVENKDL